MPKLSAGAAFSLVWGEIAAGVRDGSPAYRWIQSNAIGTEDIPNSAIIVARDGARFRLRIESIEESPR